MGLPKKKDNELGKSLLRRTGHGKNRIVSSRHTTAAEAEAEGATGTAISITGLVTTQFFSVSFL